MTFDWQAWLASIPSSEPENVRTVAEVLAVNGEGRDELTLSLGALRQWGWRAGLTAWDVESGRRRLEALGALVRIHSGTKNGDPSRWRLVTTTVATCPTCGQAVAA